MYQLCETSSDYCFVVWQFPYWKLNLVTLFYLILLYILISWLRYNSNYLGLKSLSLVVTTLYFDMKLNIVLILLQDEGRGSQPSKVCHIFSWIIWMIFCQIMFGAMQHVYMEAVLCWICQNITSIRWIGKLYQVQVIKPRGNKKKKKTIMQQNCSSIKIWTATRRKICTQSQCNAFPITN